MSEKVKTIRKKLLERRSGVKSRPKIRIASVNKAEIENLVKLGRETENAIRSGEIDDIIAGTGEYRPDPYELPENEPYEPKLDENGQDFSENDEEFQEKKKKLPKLAQYRQGGEGFILWAEENVRVSIYKPGDTMPSWVLLGELPNEIVTETGKRLTNIWEQQKKVAINALQMSNGRFKHRLIIFCWMRGEGKSLLACLIQLWKFFCFPKQQIMLGANSKDQVKFVHYDIMREIIMNSPRLLKIVGKKNVQEKEIRLRDGKGNIVSIIRSISSFSGIVSNISGYTFSEMFDMKNPKFFTQLDGSIRNIPNAMGVIDSTVSVKTHILYKLYMTWFSGKDPTLFFSYRCSPDARSEDFWNAQMSTQQLNSYKVKFPEAEFAQYFKNTWDVTTVKYLSDEVVDACHYLGWNNHLGMQKELVDFCKRKLTTTEFQGNHKDRDSEVGHSFTRWSVESQRLDEKKAIRVDSVYSLTDDYGRPRLVTVSELNKLSNLYDTDFAILAGIDRADPMKKDITQGARTIVTIVAKGLPNSRSNPKVFNDDSADKRYVYFIVGLFHIEMNDMNGIKKVLQDAQIEYGSIESLCGERWGLWDLADWCINHDINFEALQPTYAKQMETFSHLYELFTKGYLKTPRIPVQGSKGDDIFVEESTSFTHNNSLKFYGSPEKDGKNGVQDDVMFSLGWADYGGRMLTMDDFKPRIGNINFGEFIPEETIGDY